MLTLTKTITTDDGADIALERVTDDPAEITTLRASGWEQGADDAEAEMSSSSESAPPAPPAPPVPAVPAKALTKLS